MCEPVEIRRAKIEGFHDAIKRIIEEIENIEFKFISCNQNISPEFIKLKIRLSEIVCKKKITPNTVLGD